MDVVINENGRRKFQCRNRQAVKSAGMSLFIIDKTHATGSPCSATTALSEISQLRFRLSMLADAAEVVDTIVRVLLVWWFVLFRDTQ